MGLKGSLRNVSTGVIAIPDSDLTQKAVHRYAIIESSEDTVEDIIGNNDGTISGGVTFEDGQGGVGGFVLKSDGNTGNEVALGNLSGLNSSQSEYTITFWGKTDGEIDSAYAWGDSSANKFWQIQEDSPQEHAPRAGGQTLSTRPSQEANEWFMATLRFKGGEFDIWIDDDEAGTQSSSVSSTDDWDEDAFLLNRSDGERPWEGWIDDVVYVDEAVNDSDIIDHYNETNALYD